MIVLPWLLCLSATSVHAAIPETIPAAAVREVRVSARARKQSSDRDPGVWLLENARLFDGSGNPPREEMTILIEAGTIVALTDGILDSIPEEARVLDLEGRAVLPGLIDAHTHLATDPGEAGYEESVRAQLRSFLGAGITDVRDMAGDGRVLAFLARQTQLGAWPGPDVHYATVLAGPGFFRDPRIQSASRGATLGEAAWAHAVDSETDLAALMQRVRGVGATGIKLYADIDPELMLEVVQAAHGADLRVWSHWVVQPRRTKAMDALRAGVDVVSHAYMLMFDAPPEERASSERVIEAAGGEALFELMLAQGSVLDATLIAAAELPQRPGWISALECSAEVVRRAWELGIPIATGSDHPGRAGVPGVHLEYDLLVREAGLTTAQVLHCATNSSARAIGIEAQRAGLAVGSDATLLIFDEDPLADVVHWRAPSFVMKRGWLYSGKDLRGESPSVSPRLKAPTNW